VFQPDALETSNGRYFQEEAKRIIKTWKHHNSFYIKEST